MLEVYRGEEAALAAVKRNSAIVLPYLCKPAFIDGSWAVLQSMMSEEEAREVITKNPGVLASNPAFLQRSNADEIKRAAGVVDVVEALPMAARYGIVVALSAAATAIVAGGALDVKMGA